MTGQPVQTFWYLRVGDFVRFDDELQHIISCLPYDEDCDSLKYELPGCVLEVHEILESVYPEEANFKMRCVVDCGNHFIEELTEKQYVRLTDYLGTPPLLFASMQDVFSVDAEAEAPKECTFMSELSKVMAMIKANKLPVNHRLANRKVL